MPDENVIRLAQRAIVLQALDHERTRAELERIVGHTAGEAVRTLAREDVIVRQGEQVWASPCLLHLDALGLIAV